MKIKTNSLLLWGTILCFMLDIGYQYLPVFKHLYLGYSLQIEAMLCVGLAAWCWLDLRKQKIMRPYIKRINGILAITLLLLLIEFAYTVQYTNLKFADVWNNFLPYLKILLVYPIIYLVEIYSEDKIVKNIIIVTMIVLVYSTIVAMIYNLTGNNIDSNIITRDKAQRFGLVRLSSISLTWVCVLFSCTKALHEKEKRVRWRNFCVTIFGFLFVFFINQGRACFMAVMVMLISMYLFMKRRSKKQIAIYTAFMITVILMGYNGVFSGFLETFSADYSGSFTANTTTIRLLQLETYNNMLQQMPLSYWLGLGLRNTVEGYNLVGERISYYFLDTGLLGDFFNMGIVLIIVYVYTVWRLIAYIVSYRADKNAGFSFSVGALSFLIVGAAGYSILPFNRIIALPIIWAFTEYYHVCERKKYKND